MLALHLVEPFSHPARMPQPTDNKKEQRLLGAALRQLRSLNNMTGEQAATAYEEQGSGQMSAQNWSKYERGLAPGIFKPDVQHKLAAAIGATVADLGREREFLAAHRRVAQDGEDLNVTLLRPRKDDKPLPIRDKAMAGAWLAADDDYERQPRTFPAMRDPRFPYADQWLTEVVGDSMDQLSIFDGDLVHCVDAVAIHYMPKTGDIVEVQRRRFDGRERELSIKQVQVHWSTGPQLWPRSSNPKWRTPLDLRHGLAAEESIEVSVRALVIASIRRFST